MDTWEAATTRHSLIPHGDGDVTSEWVTCLLASHLGDDVTVDQFSVTSDECDHAQWLRVEFECSFSSTDAPESAALGASGADPDEAPILAFTACVDTDGILEAVSAEYDEVAAPDLAVIQELESVSLPEGAASPPEEDIQLLVTCDAEDEATRRRSSFYLSSSEDEDSLLPALVTFPGSGQRSPEAALSDAGDNDQTAGRQFSWVVKMPPRHPFGQLVSDFGLSRDRELTLYSLILPKLESLAAPGCIYCETDDDEEGDRKHWVLVTEDVRKQGSASLPQPLSVSCAEAVVDALAENAALFLMLKRKLADEEGRQLPDIFPALRASDLELGRHPLAVDHAGACFREMATLLRPHEPALAAWLLSRADKAMETFLRLSDIDDEDDLAVPINGFCCLENLVTSDDDRILLVDWHRCRYSRLTFDLAYFLITAAPLSFRREHTSDLLQRFTAGTLSRLKEWKVPTPLQLSLDKVVEDYRRSQTLALFWVGTDLCRRLEGANQEGLRVERRNSGDLPPPGHLASPGSANVRRLSQNVADNSDVVRAECAGRQEESERNSAGPEVIQGLSSEPSESRELRERLQDMVKESRYLDVI